MDMVGLAGRARSKPSIIITILGLAWALVCLPLSTPVDAQVSGGSQAGGAGLSLGPISQLRQQRDSLQREVRDQQSRARQFLEEEKGLLSLQAQLQQEIGRVEREIKLPQLPAEYQTKKCKLDELRDKHQATQEQIGQKRREKELLDRAIGRVQGQISQLQQLITQIQQQVAQAEQQRNLEQMERQRRAQEEAQQRVDPLTRRMSEPADPLSGLPMSEGPAGLPVRELILVDLLAPGLPGTATFAKDLTTHTATFTGTGFLNLDIVFRVSDGSIQVVRGELIADAGNIPIIGGALTAPMNAPIASTKVMYGGPWFNVGPGGWTRSRDILTVPADPLIAPLVIHININ